MVKDLTDVQELCFELVDIEEISENGYENTIDICVENKHNFILSNGLITHNSAAGSLMPTFGMEECGYYMLKGKPLNAWDVSQQKFTSNKELSDLYNIIKNTAHESPEEDGDWYEIEIDGKMQIVNENDEIFYKGSWKLVKDLL